MESRIEPLAGALPALAWRWDAETDILSGAFKVNRTGTGLTGTVELTDELGSIAVVDVHNGVICGVDIVVWPEVGTASELAVPDKLTDGRVVVSAKAAKTGVTSLEINAPLTVVTNRSETVNGFAIAVYFGASSPNTMCMNVIPINASPTETEVTNTCE